MAIPLPQSPPASGQRFLDDVSMQGFIQGMIVAIVGYASTVALLIKALAVMGASEAQIASALLFVGLAKGAISIGLSLHSRMPISIAWSTPGLALLASGTVLAGGFPAAVGAFIVAGLMIVVAAFWRPLARLISAIPKPIANAMLAGVILKLCLAPFIAIREMPLTILAILGTWLVMMRVARLWAVPAAVAVTLAAMGLQAGGGLGGPFALPVPVFVMPVFTTEAMMSIALPLFIVTMASQNITGLAVLATFGYHPKARDGLMATGLASALSALFGAPTINFAAITAALCAGTDAHADPRRRYVAAVFGGLGYILLALLAVVAVRIVLKAPPILIEAVAGLALIGAFGGAMRAATEVEEDRLPALLTFFVTASGLSVYGISGAFWGLVLGWAFWGLLRVGAARDPVGRGG